MLPVCDERTDAGRGPPNRSARASCRGPVHARVEAAPRLIGVLEMEETHRIAAARMRELLAVAPPAPAAFRAAITAVPPTDRDAWLDLVLEIDGLPDDGPDLPPGCVPYLPCAVDTLLRMSELAGITSSDVFVDVGAGVGRAAALIGLVTGAATVAIEIQAHLAGAARALDLLVPAAGLSVVEGDATRSTEHLARGTVFFLYCPFGGERLTRMLGILEAIAAAHPIRVCCVDLPLPPSDWLTPITPLDGALTIFRSAPRVRAACPDP